MAFKYVAIGTAVARAWQAGGADAYGNRPEYKISDGSGNPCRHCLTGIAAGKGMLVLAHRPFSALQPYAETGPIFLCAEACERHPDSRSLPPLFGASWMLLVKAYGDDERIIYGTGATLETASVDERVAALFGRPEVRFVDLRSAANNCFQCWAERA